MGKIDPREVAICTVHGTGFRRFYSKKFVRKYGWPLLQIQQLRRYTPPGYRVFSFGNELIPEHEAFLRSCEEVVFFSSKDHGSFYPPWPIRNWLSRQAAKEFKYIIHMDSDAFPVRSDWLEQYCSQITPKCPVIAIKRIEDGTHFSHTSFLMFSAEGFKKHYFDFSQVGVIDAGAGISQYIEEEGLEWRPLLRSNRHNFHPVISGIYDDTIYHHGAGSRRPSFTYHFGQSLKGKTFQTKLQKRSYRKKQKKNTALTHYFLMNQVFVNTDSFINQLLGIEKPLDLERETRKISFKYIQWRLDTELRKLYPIYRAIKGRFRTQ